MIRRVIGALTTLVWLIVLLAGVPAALIGLIGWPLPDHWPTAEQWQQWLAQPLTRSTLLGGIAIVGWLLWTVLLYAVVVEILSRARRVVGWLGRLRLPQLPVPLHTAASSLLGVAVLGAATGAGHPPTTAVAQQAVPTAAPAAHPHPSSTPAAAHEQISGPRRPWATESPGVSLPDGGWVDHDTATAAAQAAALVWLRRRRRYLPRPPSRARRDDPDLIPLPDTVTVIQHALLAREDGEQGAHDPPATRTAAEVPASATGRIDRLLRPTDLPAGGVGLTGPGAAHAARGLLATLLLPAAAGHLHSDVELFTTRADTETLLGGSASRLAVPGLTVATDLDDALSRLEQQLPARGRTSNDDPADPAAASGAAPRAAMPRSVLLAGSPTDTATARRLAILLAHNAAAAQVAGVLLGPWPHGATWHVDLDGATDTATASVGVRMCVLSATAAADLLTLVGEARSGPQNSAHLSATAGQPLADPAAATASATHSAPPPPAPSVRANHPAQPHSRAAFRLYVLGPPRILAADAQGSPVHLARKAALQILVFLAVHPGGATSGELAAALWPSVRPRPTGRFYTAVSSLRTALPAGTGAILRHGEHYRLNGELVEVDLWRLHAALDAVAAAGQDGPARQDALRAVTACANGDLAAGQYWPWLHAPREAIRRQLLDIYTALADLQPDPHATLQVLRDALHVDPDNQALRRRAIAAATDVGDHLLAGQLAADPSPS